jgi:hypothetical protein
VSSAASASRWFNHPDLVRAVYFFVPRLCFLRLTNVWHTCFLILLLRANEGKCNLKVSPNRYSSSRTLSCLYAIN